ncbi:MULTISPECIES: hypothetical protein [Bradyrhizobium]|uniref:hypothetical protein n=1 Tax=Bradyrhizobium TaxID=374 RepID=UPI00167C548E|nr:MULTISPECIES: hypothetical protein [Bradyrhizobium]
MIAHEIPSESSNRCVAPFYRSTHKLLFEIDALFLLLLGRNAFFQCDYGSLRRLAAETKKSRMKALGLRDLAITAFAALTD